MDISVFVSVIALAVSLIFLSLVLTVRSLWTQKNVFAIITLMLSVVSLVSSIISLFGASKTGPAVLFLSLSLILLSSRIRYGRLPHEFLKRSSRLHVTGYAIITLVILALSNVSFGPIGSVFVAYAIAGIIAALIVMFLVHSVWTIRHYATHVHSQEENLNKLPTVSLVIPARNEDHALTDCLHAAVASTYRKLEIIVLDDCSQDGTSQIVKSFAQEGVRFVRGDEPSSGWLGKTHAYKTLAEEAQGDYLLYIGVDTILEPTSIAKLVQYAHEHSLDMLSVMPRQQNFFGLSVLLPTWRYLAMILTPLSARHIPVSSECWMIKKTTLHALGGFNGVKHKIVPEGSFARRLHLGGRYRFLIANKNLPMSFSKKWGSFLQTQLRLDYPTHKRQPLRMFVYNLVLGTFVLTPFVMLALTSGVLWWVAFGLVVGLYVIYAFVLVRLQPRFWFLTVWFMPIMLLQAIVVSFMSFVKYEFGTVDWKGRNVCFPVLLHKRNQ